MDSQRNLFLIAFLFVSFMIWQTWQSDHAPQPQQTPQNTSRTTDNAASRGEHTRAQGKIITVKTDVLALNINTRGGDVEQAQLLAYSDKLGSSQPFVLLENKADFVYEAQSGLTGPGGTDDPNSGMRPLYDTTKTHFELGPDDSELRVPMTFTAKDGVTYTKIFVLKRGEYAINVDYQINNRTQKPLELLMYGQLKQTVELPKYRDTGSNNFALHTFRGIAYSSKQTNFQKVKFDNVIDDKPLEIKTPAGWVAMQQQYFASAWIPHTAGDNTLYTTNFGNGVAAVGYKSSTITVPPGSQQDLTATLWVGPEIQHQMAAIAPHLDLTVDYGWLWFISQPLFKLLKFLHSFIGNWGWSIIAITFIVRGIMYPLTRAQYTSMAKMRMLQPKIQAMRERVGDDKQRLSQEMMALYKSEKVNPLGGCFPLLIQMPIFLALYYMLSGSVELRHAPFALWIKDLSAQDPYYILPILMGLTMFFIQKMSPTTVTDPMQQKIMTYMPVVFTVFFLWFPSGLVLYYIVSNLVTIIQQQLIYRDLEKRGLHSRDKKKA